MPHKAPSHANVKSDARQGCAPSCAKAATKASDPTHTFTVLRQLSADPRAVSPSDVLILQQKLGNRAVERLLGESVGRRNERAEEVGVAEIRAAAERGRQTPALALPFADRIQQSFGRHDVSQIRAHLGPDASASAESMNAEAYATGDDVVFAGRPTLHTAAHEAAHVVQQRAGRRPSGGVGEAGDAYERNADAVAERVTAGLSAESLLDEFAGARETRPRAGGRPPGDDPRPPSGRRAQTSGAAAVARRRSRSPRAAPSDAPVQRVAVRRNATDRDTMRDHLVGRRILDGPSVSRLNNDVGSTNVIEAGLNEVGLLLHNGSTIAELAAVFAAINQGDLPQMFVRLGATNVGLVRRLSAMPAAVITEFFALPLAPAPSAAEIETWFGNYLILPNAPAVYRANDFADFQAQMTGPPRRYRDFAAAVWRTMPDAYDRYVRQNAGANLTMANFAAAVYGGQNVAWDTGQLGAVPNWQANAANTITRQVLAIIGAGLPMVNAAFNNNTLQALDILAANAVAAGMMANGMVGRMQALLTLLAAQPDARMFQALDIYVRLLRIDQTLAMAQRPAPLWGAGWELAFAQGISGLGLAERARVAAWINATNGRLNTLRGDFHNIDNTPAPNFNAVWTAAGRVFVDNRAQYETFMANARLIMEAVPHENAVNLPFGNRAGGLAGHFKKHVLGVGNVDVPEPARWLAHLNLVGRITRADLGALTAPQELAIFGANGIAPAAVLTPPQAAQLILLCQAGGPGVVAPANALSGAYANDYHQAVSDAYDDATASYFYVQGGRPKINAYGDSAANNIFVVSAWENGQFDFSSGYIPAMGAQNKWQQEHNQRLWEQ